MIHPDDHHLLHDWPIYGPKRPEIADLVQALAEKGLRVETIEDQIEAFLREKLRELERQETSNRGL
ncbi:hypothetical protein [Microvirga pudoricolor]|uniref:hypothetical protein n=1 Tax=Microvirga pudoricolor TaxID=2778729 RepID=UPI00194FF7D1|nr:hypothetical protein [Microvirga pudoricolor]MBM6593957.1 hypothetical protein [Microvirga pudoricolor]